MNKLKKTLALLLSLVMILSLLPAVAFADGEELPEEVEEISELVEEEAQADGENVAQIGSTEYATLEAALDEASSGDTVKLIADIDYSTTYTVRNARDNGNGHAVDLKDCILEMNGHTIKSINATVTFGGSNATIKNGTFDLVEKNTDGSYKDGSYALIIDNYVNEYGTNGKVTLENLTIDGGLNIKKSTVDVKNCTSRTTTTGYYAIWTEDDAVVTVNSGTYAAGNATPTSEGVIATGTSTATGFDHEAGSKLYIKGGSFNANGDKLVSSLEEGSVVITGGTFTADPSAYVDTENYIVTNNNGTWTVQAKKVAQIGDVKYETLAAAVAAANATEGEVTITLLRDYDMEANEPGYGYTTSFVAAGENTPRNNMIEISDGITFDLGGHTLSNLFNNTFKVTGNGVTIQNGTMLLGQLYYGSYSATKGVTLYAEPTYGSYIMFVDGAQNLTIDNLVASGINVAGGSTAVINGMTFRGYGFYAVCAQENSTVTLNGGTYDKAEAGKANILFWVEEGSTMNIKNGTYIMGSASFISGVNPIITGGTFDFDPTNKGVAEGYEVVANNNGTYTVQAKYVAKIGTAMYETLTDAVAAVQDGQTITLLTDITFASNYSVAVWEDKNFNLNLNGHTITTNSGVGTGLSNMGYTASALCFSTNSGSVKIYNGEIETAYGAGVYADDTSTSVTLEDLTINASTEGEQSTKEYSSAVRLTSGATVVINSGSYTGAYAIAVSNSGGVVTVNGGTFNGGIFFSTGTNNGVTKSITINGGNFTGNFENTNKGTLVITGGNFTADPTAYVPEGYEVVDSTVSGYTYTVRKQAHVHSYDYENPTVFWAKINGKMTAVFTYACSCGEVERKIVSENTDTTIVASNENPGVNASYNDAETVYDAYDGHGNKVTRKETAKFQITLQGGISSSVNSDYNWGEICRLTSSDNLAADWYIVDGGTQILAAVNKSVYSFPVTEDVTIYCTEHNGSQTDYHDRAISAKLESTETKKATFQTKWTLPDGATVKSVKVYRGYTSGTATISQDTLRQYGTAMNVNLLVRNGDYKLNLSNLTTGTYQHVMIEITYRTSGLDVDADDLVFTSEVQQVEVQ